MNTTTNTPVISLRRTTVDDLHTLFIFQTDPDGIRLAAFTPNNPSDKEAYITKYSKFLDEPTINNQTIYFDDRIVGSISKFEIEGAAELTYWIDSAYWGKGIASAAMEAFLALERMRPIMGRVAFDNIASQKVLEKAGFKRVGTDKGFANARQAEIEEYIYRLS